MSRPAAKVSEQPSSSPAAHPRALPRNIFAYVWQTGRRHQIALAILAVAVFLLTMAPLELQRRIVNSALKSGSMGLIAWLCAAYAGLALVSGGLKLALNVYRGWVSERAVLDLRRTVYDRIGKTESSEPARQGAVGMSIVLAEADPVGGFVGMSISEPLQQGGTLLTVLGYMVYLQPSMALFCFGLFSLQVLFVPPMQQAINRRAAARIKTLRALSGEMVDELGAVATPLKNRGVFNRQAKRIFRINMQVYWLKFAMNFLMNLVYHLGIVGVLLVGGWYVVQQRLDIGTVVAFISGLSQINEPWGDLVNYFRELMTAQVKYGLIAKVTEQPEAAANDV